MAIEFGSQPCCHPRRRSRPRQLLEYRRLLPAFCGGLLVCICQTTGWAIPASRILVINSYHEGYPWTSKEVKGIRTGEDWSALKTELYIEYLDARRFAPDDAFVGYLRNKYAKAVPNLIITTDDPATRFLIESRSSLFPGVPVVFCGVNEFKGSSSYVTADASLHAWMTGVLEPIELEPTVDLALRLHPNTRQVVTIGEDENVQYVERLSARYPALKIHNIPVRRLSLEQTASELDNLQQGTIVLFSAFVPEDISVTAAAKFVAEHAHVPVYTLSRTSMGTGIAGGKMADPLEQGRQAAHMARSILSGTPVSALPIQAGDAVFTFDYPQLKHWGIRDSALPPNSVILNRPKPIYVNHPLLGWALASFALIQSAVILYLLVQRRRRRAAEAALEAHTQQLAQSNYMLEQFAYVAAHDFQEPIRTVALFTELLSRRAREALDSDGREAMEFVLTHSRKLHLMVRGLLAWVRAVEVPPNSAQQCSADEAVEQALALNQEAIAANSVSIKAEKLPLLNMHAQHARELFHQLIQNAIQHGGTDQITISIGARLTDEGWRVGVHDSGPGIPKELQTRIFGVFRHLNVSGHGLGMGLAICRRIVDYYGGRIWVESEEGHGSSFFFTVPCNSSVGSRRSPWRRFKQQHAHTHR